MSDNIKLDKQIIEKAKITACKIQDEDLRKRAYALNIAAAAAAEYINSCGLNADIKNSLFRTASFMENFELADVYVDGARLDVRVTFNAKDFCIPKIQEKFGATPCAYVVVQLNASLKNAKILGFVPSSELGSIKTEYEYFCYETSILKPMSQLRDFLSTVEVKQDIFSTMEHEKIKELSVAFMDGEISQSEKVYFIKHILACPVCREIFCDMNDFDMIVSQVKNYHELLNDSTLSVFAGNQKEFDEALLANLATVENAQEDLSALVSDDESEYVEETVEEVEQVEEVEETGFLQEIAEPQDLAEFLDSEDLEAENLDPENIEEACEEINGDKKTENNNDLEDSVVVTPIAGVVPIVAPVVGAIPTAAVGVDIDLNLDGDLDLSESDGDETSLLNMDSESAEEEEKQEEPEVQEQALAEEPVIEQPLTDETVQEPELILEGEDELLLDSETEELLEPVIEEMIVEDMVVAESSIEETVLDETPTDETLVDELITEEPVELEEIENVEEIEPIEAVEEPIEEVEADITEMPSDIKIEHDEDNIESLEIGDLETLDSIGDIDSLEEIHEVPHVQEEVEEIVEESKPFELSLEGEEIQEQEPVELIDEDEALTEETTEDVQEPQELSYEEDMITEIEEEPILEPSLDVEIQEEIQEEPQESQEDDSDIKGLLDDDLLALLSDEDNSSETAAPAMASSVDEDSEYNFEEKIAEVEQTESYADESESAIEQDDEETFEQEPQEDDDNTIGSLFEGEDGESQDGEQKEFELAQEPVSEKTVNATKKIIVAAAVLMLLAGGGIAAWFVNNAKANADKAALEAGNQDELFDLQNQAGKSDSDSPALSQDINRSMANSFSDKPAAITITKISWQVSEKLAQEASVKEYLQSAGKNIQMNLQNDLANAPDINFNNSIKVSFEIAPDNTLKGIQVLESSGSDQIDDMVMRSIKNTLKYVKVPQLKNFKSDYFLTLIINF